MKVYYIVGEAAGVWYPMPRAEYGANIDGIEIDMDRWLMPMFVSKSDAEVLAKQLGEGYEVREVEIDATPPKQMSIEIEY